MKAIQYTIRNVPGPVDRYLRKRAALSGLSLNQVIIDELSEKAGQSSKSLTDELAWFIGSGADQEVMGILAEDDKKQKRLVAKEYDS